MTGEPAAEGQTEARAGSPAWHELTAADAARALHSDLRDGLSVAEAARRAERYGPNEVPDRPPRTVWAMLAEQFIDFLILVLMAAAVVSAVTGDLKDAIVIAVIVVLNAVIGVIQEWRAERALAALKDLMTPTAVVIRGGQSATVPAADLVPGDLVVLDEGEIVPADLRLADVAALRVDESVLTGESVPVDKRVQSPPDGGHNIADRTNMAYKGTVVTHGHARGLVTGTGSSTELGRIAALLHEEGPPKTPLQLRLARFGQRLGVVILLVCAAFFAFGLARGEPALLMFMTAVSLAVAAIPEALPAVVTIALAVSAREMARRNALVRGLPAVEALGSVSYICTDKTGTLTLNSMHVAALETADGSDVPLGDPVSGEAPHALLTAIALCTETSASAEGGFLGDPTETALAHRARDAGYHRPEIETERARINVFPFDAERKRMTTVHAKSDGAVVYVKGAPEAILPLCAARLTDAGPVPLERDAALEAVARLASKGMRVLAVAERHMEAFDPDAPEEEVERDLTFLGLIGLIDPPRPEAQDAVAQCQRAGITPVMITGDHPATARAIGETLGIIDGDGRVLTGAELAAMDDAAFDKVAGDIRIYARADPSQKIRIVEALQRRGAFVAMTGDGVNDAPALKRANIGVAMGHGGTDVAKEASRLVLLDDNFATIVTAVREGRRIYDNIRKFIKYTMTSNSAEILTLLLPPLFGLPLALLPIHILWINLVTDALPGLALAFEPDEPDTMDRPPRAPDESVFAGGMWQHIIWCGAAMGAIAILTQALSFWGGDTHWQTMVFTVLTLAQMGHVLAIRSDRRSLFEIGVFSNLPLLLAVMLTFVLQLVIIYVPLFNTVFNTAPLTLLELAICLAASALVFVLVEIEKLLVRQGWLYRSN